MNPSMPSMGQGGVTPWLPPTSGSGNTSMGTLAGGVPTDTNSLLAALYPGQQQQQPQQAPASAQPQEKGNFLTKLLPTLGSMGIWGIGALLAPETGGMSLLGSAALQGVGGAGGKAVENLAEGQNIGNGLLSSGVEGALGGIGGGLLGKVGKGLLGKVGGALSNNVANAAEKQAVADQATQLAQEFPEKALNAGAKQNLNFGGSLDLAEKAGIPKTAQGFMQASQAGTGSNGYLNGVLDSLVRNNGNVDLSDFGQTVENAISKRPELGSLTATTGGAGGLPKPASNLATNTKQLFENLLQQHGYGGEGSLTNTAEPDNAIKLLRTIGDLGSKYTGSEQGSTGSALKDVYSQIYQGLKGNIYNRPAIDEAVSGFQAAPEDMAALLKATGGNQQLTNHLVDVVNNAKKAQDILSPQQQFINMGTAGQKASDYIKNVVGTSQAAKAAAQEAEQAAQPNQAAGHAVLGGLLGKLGVGGAMMTGNPLMLAPAILGSQPVKNAAAAVTEKLASSGVQQRVAKLIAPALTGASQFVAHAPNYAPGAVPTTTTGETGMNPGQPTGQPQASPTQDMLRMALVGMQNPLYASTFAPIVNSLLTGPMQHAGTANAALSSAESAFSGAGGGQGMIGGLLGKLGGAVTGGPASTYDAQRQQLIAQLTALGLPTSAVPQITNTPEAAASQWQTLQNMINSVTGNGLLGAVPAAT